MSYAVDQATRGKTTTQDFQVQQQMDDNKRLAFLKRLDAAPVEVTDWEAQFIKSFIDAPRQFTDRQRECVDKMRKHYAGI
jgi:hypothetical protein